MNPRKVDLVGEAFGEGTVVAFEGRDAKHKTRQWKLICSCGKEYTTTTGNLRAGHVRSCGHLVADARRREASAKRGISLIGTENAALNNYERHYKGSGKDYKLTRDEFGSLVRGNCFYCGAPPTTPRRARVFRRAERAHCYYGEPVLVNGIDRVDSSKGYTSDNCVPCCMHCNYAKNSMTREEFEEWIARVYNHLYIRR